MASLREDRQVVLQALGPVSLLVLSSKHKAPAVWGFPSSMTAAPTAAPEGPHSWEQPTASRATFRCGKCGTEVFVGTDDRSLSRVAGSSCAEALVKAVMES